MSTPVAAAAVAAVRKAGAGCGPGICGRPLLVRASIGWWPIKKIEFLSQDHIF